ncbi:MAG: hypothetical protein PHR77_00130 [Kiritimatiellae bacterium]|nr:hypothetical protein [Kiritimatiellia bacterium]MDD5519221.1 hypothetical protein [Kiritimatiellia bacterium]
MRILYFMLFICAGSLITANKCLSQDQKQDKESGKEMRVKQHESGFRGEKAFMREGGLKMGSDGGIQDAIIGKIVNNPQVASEVGLSEEQVKTLKNSLAEMKKQFEDFQKQLKESGLEQAKIMTGDSVDENALFTAVEKAGKIRTEMAKVRIRQMLLVKKTLTPEQINKVREMVQKRVKQMRSEGEMRSQKGDSEHPRKHKEKKKDDAEKPASEL